MRTPLLLLLSHLTGWCADRRIPRPLRAPLYRTYARIFGVNLGEVRPPLDAYPSLGAFFVRRLVEGARPFPEDPGVLASPVDGTLQTLCRVERGSLLQAKGRPYPLEELLGSAGEGCDLEGGRAWTIYLSPRDYHRIHAPLDGRLVWASWLDGARFSVQPSVLRRRARVLSVNERCVLRFETPVGPFFLVLVGALNVGRIRVVGVEPGPGGLLTRPLELARGDELARFEMGSTAVLVFPAGRFEPVEGPQPGQPLRLGQALARPVGPD